MERNTWQVSTRTKVIARTLLVPFAGGGALVLALLMCFAADLLGLWRDAVARIFPTVLMMLVYDAAVTLLLRVALYLSARRDRSV